MPGRSLLSVVRRLPWRPDRVGCQAESRLTGLRSFGFSRAPTTSRGCESDFRYKSLKLCHKSAASGPLSQKMGVRVPGADRVTVGFLATVRAQQAPTPELGQMASQGAPRTHQDRTMQSHLTEIEHFRCL